MSKSELKRLIEQNPEGMADRIIELERMCGEKDAEIAKLKGSFAEIQHNQATLIRDGQQQLSEAQAQIAMQAEALKLLHDSTTYIGYPHKRATDAISATSETIAAFRAKETEPLRREVAMLRRALSRIQDDTLDDSNRYVYITAKQALEHGEATALAYEREVKAKALEELVPIKQMWTAASGKYWYMHIQQKILELRSTQEVGNE